MMFATADFCEDLSELCGRSQLNSRRQWPQSASREDHSLLEEEASIRARFACVDDGISFTRTFIELFASQALKPYMLSFETVDNSLAFLLNFRDLFGGVDLHHSKSRFVDEGIEWKELHTGLQCSRQVRSVETNQPLRH